jgi:hypothetical protein
MDLYTSKILLYLSDGFSNFVKWKRTEKQGNFLYIKINIRGAVKRDHSCQ